jgi:uncharacterized protein (TIGR02453 family)
VVFGRRELQIHRTRAAHAGTYLPVEPSQPLNLTETSEGNGYSMSQSECAAPWTAAVTGTEVHASPSFPNEAFAYFEGLAVDNSKEYFRRNRETFDRAVYRPMAALVAALSGEFGDVMVLRPQRDSRFSNDKSPYKRYQGAYVDIQQALGFWVHLDASGLYASGRFYPRTAVATNLYRAAVDDDVTGVQLAALMDELVFDGFSIGGDRLKTRPRAVLADHPRLDLMRHRTLDFGRTFARRPGAGLPDPLSAVRSTWRAVRPLLDWLYVHTQPQK